jgi:MoaA/NifB/PqqE/SkfB family radical SAM enzyme
MKPFKRTYIEITNVCNLSCTFCPGTSRRKEFMTPESFDHILKNFGRHATHLYFHVLGEPLLHPSLGELLDIAHRYGKVVNLSTNGILIDKVGNTILGKPSLRQITFSMHSFRPAGSESPEAYLDPIIEFIRATSEKHIIRLRLWSSDEPDPQGTRKHFVARLFKEFRAPEESDFSADFDNGVQLDKNVFLNPAHRFEWPDSNGPTYGDTGFCLGLREQVAVLVNGDVVPCCLDKNGDIVVGNALRQPLREILDSPRARLLYSGFSQRSVVEPLCLRCSYRLRFNPT